MQYRPKNGDEIDLTAEVIAAKTKHLAEVTRSAIALAIVIAVTVTLVVTAALCAYRRDFEAVEVLWAVVAAPLGCIIGYYFRGTGTNGKEDYTGTT